MRCTYVTWKHKYNLWFPARPNRFFGGTWRWQNGVDENDLLLFFWRSHRLHAGTTCVGVCAFKWIINKKSFAGDSHVDGDVISFCIRPALSAIPPSARFTCACEHSNAPPIAIHSSVQSTVSGIVKQWRLQHVCRRHYLCVRRCHHMCVCNVHFHTNAQTIVSILASHSDFIYFCIKNKSTQNTRLPPHTPMCHVRLFAFARNSGAIALNAPGFAGMLGEHSWNLLCDELRAVVVFENP